MNAARNQLINFLPIFTLIAAIVVMESASGLKRLLLRIRDPRSINFSLLSLGKENAMKRAMTLIVWFSVVLCGSVYGQEGAGSSQGGELGSTAKIGEWIKADDLEFRVVEARRGALVQLSVKIFLTLNKQESRFKPVVDSQRGGLRPEPRLFLKGDREITFLPFDEPLKPGERPLEIVAVVVEGRSSKVQTPADKARLLDKAGKIVATADNLQSLLINQLYDWGAAKLKEKQQIFLFAVSPEQKDLRFQLTNGPAVILESAP